MGGGQGTIRVALAFAALLASLALVVARQSRALESLRELDRLRSERAVAESERSSLATEIQRLEGRARIIDVAEARLGMRLPAAGTENVVLLRVPRPNAAASPPAAPAVAVWSKVAAPPAPKESTVRTAAVGGGR